MSDYYTGVFVGTMIGFLIGLFIGYETVKYLTSKGVKLR